MIHMRPELINLRSSGVVQYLSQALKQVKNVPNSADRELCEQNLVALFDTTMAVLISINSRGHTEAAVNLVLQNLDALLSPSKWLSTVSKHIPALSQQTTTDLCDIVKAYVGKG